MHGAGPHLVREFGSVFIVSSSEFSKRGGCCFSAILLGPLKVCLPALCEAQEWQFSSTEPQWKTGGIYKFELEAQDPIFIAPSIAISIHS